MRSAIGIATLTFLTGSIPGNSFAQPNLRASTRTPVWFVVVGSPKNAEARLQRAAQLAFESETNLVSKRAGPEQVSRLERCPSERRLSCWVATLEPERRPDSARFIVVASHPVDAHGRGTLSTALVDVEAAWARLAGIADTDSKRLEQAEEAIFQASVLHTTPEVADVQSALQNEITTQIRSRWRPLLERAAVSRAPGSVIVRHTDTSMVVIVDDQTLGPATAPSTRIDGVPPGKRTVVIDDRGTRAPMTANVVSGAVSYVDFDAGPAGWVPSAVLWGGAAASAASVAVAAVAIARASDNTQLICVPRMGENTPCADLGPITTGYRPGSAPTLDPGTVNPSGVQLGALAAGLGALGATWVIGSLLDLEAGTPWWTIVSGIAAGAVGFSVVQAVN